MRVLRVVTSGPAKAPIDGVCPTAAGLLASRGASPGIGRSPGLARRAPRPHLDQLWPAVVAHPCGGLICVREEKASPRAARAVGPECPAIATLGRAGRGTVGGAVVAEQERQDQGSHGEREPQRHEQTLGQQFEHDRGSKQASPESNPRTESMNRSQKRARLFICSEAARIAKATNDSSIATSHASSVVMTREPSPPPAR